MCRGRIWLFVGTPRFYYLEHDQSTDDPLRKRARMEAVAADGGKAYNIQDWARVYLKGHTDLVGGNRKPNSAAQGDS